MDWKDAETKLLQDPGRRKAYFGNRTYYAIDPSDWRGRRCDVEYFSNRENARKFLKDLYQIYGHKPVEYNRCISVIRPDKNLGEL